VSFNRIQSRALSGFLTGYCEKTSLHYGADRQSIFWRRGSEDTSAHILFACQALATLRHTYLVSFFFDPEDVRSRSLVAIWYFIRGTELPRFGHQCQGHKGSVKKAQAHHDQKGSNPFIILFHSYM